MKVKLFVSYFSAVMFVSSRGYGLH